MSPPQKQKIEHLLSLVREGLSEDNLNKLVSATHELSQDTGFFLLLFALKHIFLELANALEGEAVDFQGFHDLTDETGSKIVSILQSVCALESVPYEELEDLISLHIAKLSLFKNR